MEDNAISCDTSGISNAHIHKSLLYREFSVDLLLFNVMYAMSCNDFLLTVVILCLPGKSYTMIGRDDSLQGLGIIPCAISWLFKLINERKEKTGARFSVRVSAVEV